MRAGILTVTLNPAVDITYHVAALDPGRTHRVSRVDERLGGKGVNVAAVLAQLGVPVRATGLLGAELLAAGRLGAPAGPAGLTGFSPMAGPTRRTVVVADGCDATGFWEPGPVVSAAEWAAFRDRFDGLLRSAEVVVLSGSLPGGVPVTAYADLITMARVAGVPTILDSSGPALALGLAAGPDLVKPNADELAELSADPPGHTTVVESHGPAGLRVARWRARPPRPIDGNPTGAGDACVAALARGLLHGTAWPELLRDAVALSAAAVAAPVAGAVDLDLYRQLLPDVIVEETL